MDGEQYVRLYVAISRRYDTDIGSILTSSTDFQPHHSFDQKDDIVADVVLFRPSGAVSSIRAAADVIVTAGADGMVRVLDPRASFRVRNSLTGPGGFLYSLHVAGRTAFRYAACLIVCFSAPLPLCFRSHVFASLAIILCRFSLKL